MEPKPPNNVEENIDKDDKSWDIHPGINVIDDPLLGCLVILTRIEHKPATPEMLSSGLPLENGRITPALFVRAAERVKLSAKIVKRKLSHISPLVLPAVLLLKNQGACLLVSFEKDKMVKIIQPETGDGVVEIKWQDLKKQYSGFSIFTRPHYSFNERSQAGLTDELAKIKKENWFWSVMYKILPFYGQIIVASILINIFALCSPLFTMNVYDRVVPNHAFETLWVLVVGVFIIYLFDFLMKSLRSYFIDIAGKKADILLSAKIFEHMMAVKMEARPESVGSFANNIGAFDSFREFITSTTLTIIIDLPFLLLFIFVMYTIGGNLAIVPLVVVPVVVIISIITQKLLNNHVKENYRYSAEKQSLLIESLIGIENIKSSNAESPMQKRWEHVNGMSSRKNIKIKTLSTFATNITAFTQQIASIVIVILGVINIISGEMTMGALIACNMLNGRALSPLGQIASLLIRYEQSITSLKAINDLMQMPSEREADYSAISATHLSGYVELQKVSFKYPKQENNCIEDFSLQITPGEKVGIIGRIGSGKSTIEKLLLGLYEPQEGNILFDGVEHNQLDPSSIRRNIGYVPQDIVLFYGSVKDNIVIGAPYSDDRDIFRAANISGVADFIAKHPKGFDRSVGERGMELSGGQRQSIAIARALLLDPNILILDEPTNMMDTKTENIFLHRLKPFIQHKTVMLVTHNVNLLQMVDRIVIVDKGRVLADGAKDVILKDMAEGKHQT